MTGVSARVRWRVFLRSLTIQGSWNYRTLIGTGFAFALLPLLRRLHAGDPRGLEAAVARHAGLFNSHPYLAPLALGAVAAMEEAGEDPGVVERFKVAVRGPLGSLGDRLVWAGWLPALLLLALVLMGLGAAVGVAVAVFLAAYNAGHGVLRVWAFRTGLRRGKEVGGRLRGAAVSAIADRIGAGGAFLLGAAIPLLLLEGVGDASPGRWWWAAGAVGSGAGIRYGERARKGVVVAVVVVVAALTAYGAWR